MVTPYLMKGRRTAGTRLGEPFVRPAFMKFSEVLATLPCDCSPAVSSHTVIRVFGG